jgi:hypothetical protein
MTFYTFNSCMIEGIVETEEDSIHVDFEESTHENSKHHADVVEYEEYSTTSA